MKFAPLTITYEEIEEKIKNSESRSGEIKVIDDKPREPDKIGQVFKDENGNPYQDVMVYEVPDLRTAVGFISSYYHFKDGKLHGTPAIEYPDGQEEDWEDGNFVKVSCLSTGER